MDVIVLPMVRLVISSVGVNADTAVTVAAVTNAVGKSKRPIKFEKAKGRLISIHKIFNKITIKKQLNDTSILISQREITFKP